MRKPSIYLPLILTLVGLLQFRSRLCERKNFFLIAYRKVDPQHIYVFVLLNKPGEAVQYFIVPGVTLSRNSEKFTRYFLDPKMPGIHSNALTELGYENAWNVFKEADPT